jgi:hypothetical protein
VAESLVQHARLHENAVVVMGSRGLGSFTRAVLNVVGLGSVSDYCISRVPYATVVVKDKVVKEASTEQPSTEAAPSSEVTRICVCMDESEHSLSALSFAAKHLLTEAMPELHVVCVASTIQLPVCSVACSACHESAPGSHDGPRTCL